MGLILKQDTKAQTTTFFSCPTPHFIHTHTHTYLHHRQGLAVLELPRVKHFLGDLSVDKGGDPNFIVLDEAWGDFVNYPDHGPG